MKNVKYENLSPAQLVILSWLQAHLAFMQTYVALPRALLEFKILFMSIGLHSDIIKARLFKEASSNVFFMQVMGHVLELANMRKVTALDIDEQNEVLNKFEVILKWCSKAACIFRNMHNLIPNIMQHSNAEMDQDSEGGLSSILSAKIDENSLDQRIISSYDEVKGAVDADDNDNDAFNHKDNNNCNYKYDPLIAALIGVSLPMSVICDDDVTSNLSTSDIVSVTTSTKSRISTFDNGFWHLVILIGKLPFLTTADFRSLIDFVESYETFDDYQRGSSDEAFIKRFIILRNPKRVECVRSVFDRHPSCHIYIYCDNNRLKEYDRWAEQYPKKLYVYQKKQILKYALFFDVSNFLVTMGDSYSLFGKIDLAQARYRYAYRLHSAMDDDLQEHLL